VRFTTVLAKSAHTRRCRLGDAACCGPPVVCSANLAEGAVAEGPRLQGAGGRVCEPRKTTRWPRSLLTGTAGAKNPRPVRTDPRILPDSHGDGGSSSWKAGEHASGRRLLVEGIASGRRVAITRRSGSPVMIRESGLTAAAHRRTKRCCPTDRREDHSKAPGKSSSTVYRPSSRGPTAEDSHEDSA